MILNDLYFRWYFRRQNTFKSEQSERVRGEYPYQYVPRCEYWTIVWLGPAPRAARGRVRGETGGAFFVSSYKGFYLLFDSFAVAILLCLESPVICYRYHFFKALQAVITLSLLSSRDFLQVSLSLPLLTLLFNVPGARCSAAAPRYSPTKTHMHFESLVKKS